MKEELIYFKALRDRIRKTISDISEEIVENADPEDDGYFYPENFTDISGLSVKDNVLTYLVTKGVIYINSYYNASGEDIVEVTFDDFWANVDVVDNESGETIMTLSV